MNDAQRHTFRYEFVNRLCTQREVEVFLVHAQSRLIFRGIHAHRRFKVPADAIVVGYYRYPFPATDFLGDLDDVFAKLQSAGAAS